MINTFYTTERNVQIVIALLKYHNIRKVVASPGTTNITFVASLQQDPFFQIYSSVDERSAAYIACGMADESGEPVVLTCTGATASRNYFPGLTEAFYRKLPILAVTATRYEGTVGQMINQVIDRSQQPLDTRVYHVSLPPIYSAPEERNCEIKANEAILALKRHGGGPVHINLATTYCKDFSVKELPKCQIIDRIMPNDRFPSIPKGRIGIYCGSHSEWTPQLIKAVESFCSLYNAVVFVDHTSGYRGKYACLFPLITGQKNINRSELNLDLFIHIGHVSGSGLGLASKVTWRVNEDGEIRDMNNNLRYVFEMSEEAFFNYYCEGADATGDDSFIQYCKDLYDSIYEGLPALPFSYYYCAKKVAPKLPENCVVFLGIYNSLRSFNYYEWPASVRGYSNVGGFGIDGGNSSMIGASLVHPDKLYFSVIGDLGFFYDLNSIGNHHVGNNIRILLFNNGKGAEFRLYSHMASMFSDEDANKYIAAAGHYGNMSPNLVRHYAEDLGFEYLTASNKQEFDNVFERFLTPEITEKPMLLEVFTDSHDDSDALKLTNNSNFTNKSSAESIKDSAKSALKNFLGKDTISAAKKLIG